MLLSFQNAHTNTSILAVHQRSRQLLARILQDDALQLGKVQWDIVCELAAGLDDPENAAAHLDEAKAAALLDSKLAPLQAKLGVDLSTISHHA